MITLHEKQLSTETIEKFFPHFIFKYDFLQGVKYLLRIRVNSTHFNKHHLNKGQIYLVREIITNTHSFEESCKHTDSLFCTFDKPLTLKHREKIYSETKEKLLIKAHALKLNDNHPYIIALQSM